MSLRNLLLAVLVGLSSAPAHALTMSDSLASWREGSAMDRMELATRLGRNFVPVNEAFTAGYFLKCIDDISGYTNAKEAKIEDAMRECVAARLRKPGEMED